MQLENIFFLLSSQYSVPEPLLHRVKFTAAPLHNFVPNLSVHSPSHVLVLQPLTIRSFCPHDSTYNITFLEVLMNRKSVIYTPNIIIFSTLVNSSLYVSFFICTVICPKILQQCILFLSIVRFSKKQCFVDAIFIYCL